MRLLATLAMPLVFAGCLATNPVTGEREVVLMSTAQQIAMGEQSYQPYQQQQGGLYHVDPALTAYVAGVGQKLAAVSDLPELPYEFVVLNDGTPNAWALPGGKIAINRGLLALLDDEAQLAAVLGHEIVHAAAGHSAAQMTRQQFLGLGNAALGVLAANSEYGNLIMMGSQYGGAALNARYGRDDELESDEHGVKYMLRAGYDPQAAVELQQKFLALKGGNEGSFMSNLFASHPPSSERVARNQEYAQGKSGSRNKAVFLKATAQLRKDRAAYELEQQAKKYASEKKLSYAQDLIAQAIKKQPNESSFHVTQGQIYLAQSKGSQAYKSFSQAVRQNPQHFLPQLMAGATAKELKKYSDAKRYLQASVRYLATPAAHYYLGEVALAERDKTAAKNYFSVAAKDQGDVGNAARGQLAKMGVVAQ